MWYFWEIAHLVAGASGKDSAFLIHNDLAHPIVVACDGLSAVARADIPLLDGLVPRTRVQIVPSRCKDHTRDVVLMPTQGLHAFLARGAEVPELHGHVR